MTGKAKILVAEDDRNIREGLVDGLEFEGYEVREAADGRETLKVFTEWRPDLILLDVMMPKISGYDVCRQIRNGDRSVSIIMLTAKGEEIDKVLGLELGADDYVTKPFGVRELMARVSAVLRRTRHHESEEVITSTDDQFSFGNVEVNAKTMKVRTPRGEIDLTTREIELLRFFLARPNVVLDRYSILSAVWGADFGGYSRTLDQHIAQLRKKIEDDPKQPKLIETVYGVGYRFVS